MQAAMGSTLQHQASKMYGSLVQVLSGHTKIGIVTFFFFGLEKSLPPPPPSLTTNHLCSRTYPSPINYRYLYFFTKLTSSYVPRLHHSSYLSSSSACAPKNPSNTSKMYPVKEVMACGLVPSAPHPRQTSPTRFQRATKLLLLMSSLTTYLPKKQICFTELHLFHNDKTA
ncbi:hypothetical protein Pst134EA_013064 [Puccinia striiformis f. sp. tritici]|uniref:hypothetical protein n=1 Tax=Puccinia striiformis f. sp. tritici TaxID=168172 RepID=UPI0020078A2E|nr:hypothetical protein Pst134EA_013064 [Puccinia striiformis f. sp. tritici]KAH9465171.1 hypothetical protein Pst134EA_013064 [Puccinia striiformis f. sp. tritici]